MEVVKLVLDVAVKHKDKIAKAAIHGAEAAAVFAIGKAVARHEDGKIIQEEKEKSYERGIRKGSDLTIDSIQNIIIARIATAYYIARADGSVSNAEKKKINEISKQFLRSKHISFELKQEIEDIELNRSFDFEDLKKYLDRVSILTLTEIMLDVYDIAKASKGISRVEQQSIDKLSKYIDIRSNSEEPYYRNLLSEETIKKEVNEYSLKMKMLDYTFTKKTNLNKKEISLLMVATSLQLIRIYVINELTKREKAGHKNEKEQRLHKKQDKILGLFGSNDEEKPREYFAPLNQIILTHGVPYDTTSYLNKNHELFKGANHRFATLGHEPILGLIFGTANIMTNTITTTFDNSIVPMTYHVKYDNQIKNPKIANPASIIECFNSILERSKEDIKPLVASIIKQFIHIQTDLYTTAGIQLPMSQLFLTRREVDLLTSYVSTGDVMKFGASSGVNELINKMIEIIHGCMILNDSESEINDEINRVKVIKILTYSNVIATSSNVIQKSISGDLNNLDWPGLINVISKLFKDMDFIYRVKREFIRHGLGEE